MTRERLYSVDEMCRELGSYRLQLNVFLRDEGIEPFAEVSGRPVYSFDAIERLRPVIHAWKNRRRLYGKRASAIAS